MSEPIEAKPERVSVPLTAEQATNLLKMHNMVLQAKVARLEAIEKEVFITGSMNSYIQNMPRPDNGNWEVNLSNGTLDPK